MIGDVLATIAAIVVLASSMVIHPARATCPADGWYLGEGVRSSGDFACYSPVGKHCGEPSGSASERGPCPAQFIVRGSIYCTGGARPIVVNFQTVGCQR